MYELATSRLAADLAFLGDHPAINFLNTMPCVDGKLVDLLTSDADVLAWLERAGNEVHMWREPRKSGDGRLLAVTRRLRDTIRRAVEEHKAGKPANVSELNRFLANARSTLELATGVKGGVELRRRWHQETPEELLAPIAETAAELLAQGDFNLVRRCENHECVLWFYDRTKSHHRRWCSMATCGNRHKVAAYRKRLQEKA